MSESSLTRFRVKNYRILADVSLKLRPLTVLFGLNGVGKSTLLDTAWFIRDCAIRGTDEAAAERDHGIGMLWDGAEPNTPIEMTLETEEAKYEVSCGWSTGRIETFAGEKFYSKTREMFLIERGIGHDKALFRSPQGQEKTVSWHEAHKLFISRYLMENEVPEVADMDSLLRGIRYYHTRSTNFYRVRKTGSEAGYGTRLQGRADNLWSVLRNLQGLQAVDSRYATIIRFMSRAFPRFRDLVLEATGPNTVYGQFVEQGRSKPIQASGVSDGHLQMLINLAVLFGETAQECKLIFLDEPDLSLHPWALAVLAEAMQEAAITWGKQIIAATHSPVLISQFELSEVVTVEYGNHYDAILTRVSDRQDIEDLLKEYATGSLYMAETLAPQSSRDGEE